MAWKNYADNLKANLYRTGTSAPPISFASAPVTALATVAPTTYAEYKKQEDAQKKSYWQGRKQPTRLEQDMRQMHYTMQRQKRADDAEANIVMKAFDDENRKEVELGILQSRLATLRGRGFKKSKRKRKTKRKRKIKSKRKTKRKIKSKIKKR